MDQEALRQAARYRQWQAEELAILRATKDSGDRQQHRLLADMYGKRADEYEAQANRRSSE